MLPEMKLRDLLYGIILTQPVDFAFQYEELEAGLRRAVEREPRLQKLLEPKNESGQTELEKCLSSALYLIKDSEGRMRFSDDGRYTYLTLLREIYSPKIMDEIKPLAEIVWEGKG